MFHKDLNFKKPFQTSQLTAQKEAKQWLDHNAIKTITDRSGIKWKVEVIYDDVANSKGLWTCKIEISTTIKVDGLIQTNILDQIKDARLIEILGLKESISLTLNPLYFQDNTLKELKRRVAFELVNLKARFVESMFQKQKLAAIYQRIDKKLSFEHSLSK